jgi:hypothetical protein
MKEGVEERVYRELRDAVADGMLTVQKDDRRVIQCNYAEGTNIAAPDARAFVLLTNPGGGHDRVFVLVRSRSGRWVKKWESVTRLKNFRTKTLPPEHPLYWVGEFSGPNIEQVVESLNNVED